MGAPRGRPALMPSDRISLTGIEVRARHGALPEEREADQPFLVDVTAYLDLGPAAASDRLADTLDYGSLAERVAALVEGERHDLLETVAGRVAALVLEDARVERVEVTVHKPEAPLPVTARDVAVTVVRSRPSGS